MQIIQKEKYKNHGSVLQTLVKLLLRLALAGSDTTMDRVVEML
jgi:hypothetical protein